jgi:phosphotransferase system enzyme I (PtsP)
MPEFDAAIIEAHRMMLEDRGFTGKIEAAIEDGLTVEAALKRVVEDYVDQFVACRTAISAIAPST